MIEIIKLVFQSTKIGKNLLKSGIKMGKFVNFFGEARIENNGLNLFSENFSSNFSQIFVLWKTSFNISETKPNNFNIELLLLQLFTSKIIGGEHNLLSI